LPNCDARPKPTEVGMAPNVLERALSEVPRPKDDEGAAEKEDVVGYGWITIEN
jgi:hypothetical protein